MQLKNKQEENPTSSHVTGTHTVVFCDLHMILIVSYYAICDQLETNDLCTLKPGSM